MTAIYLVIVEMPWWMVITVYFACAFALAIGVGKILKGAGASYPVPAERELPVTAGSQPHRPFWE